MKRNSLTILMSLLVTLMMFSITAVAMPPSPTLLKAIQQQLVDEPYFLQNRQALLERGVNEPHFVSMDSELDETTFNSIVLLVDFSDNQFVTSPSFFDNLMYGTGIGTVADYYDEVSYGDFDLTTQDMPSSIGWLRMPHSYDYYVDGQNGFGDYPNNAQGLAEDAVLAADPYVDFSDYDFDGDGLVDGLFIMHAGTGAELSGDNDDIWSHKWDIPGGVSVDGVQAYVYAMQPEFWYSSGDMTIGVVSHEMGHAVFGLPDLYDYGYDSRGLDDWSLMAGGSWGGYLGSSPAHPDAWSRVAMGFVIPINVTSDMTNVSIANVNATPTIYRLWTQGQTGDQYFLVENRRQTGYDSSIPSQGLLIYHCDDNEWGNNDQWYPGHTNQGHYQVALEQADGLWELEQNGYADSGDPFPGSTTNRTFDNNSTPDSRNYFNQNTLVEITNISNSATTMTADFAVGLPDAPSFNVTLTPNNPPIELPSNGGTFTFEVLISNTNASAMVADAWIDAILPNGNQYHVETYTLNFQPGVDFYRPSISQDVPGFAATGVYTYQVKVGNYPGEVFAMDEFTFTKGLAMSSAPQSTSNWTITGFETPGLIADGDDNDMQPKGFAVTSAYPNPFNAETTVSIYLPVSAKVQATVFNTLGQRVLDLANGHFSAGEHRLTINAHELPSGIYFLAIHSGEYSKMDKLVLMK